MVVAIAFQLLQTLGNGAPCCIDSCRNPFCSYFQRCLQIFSYPFFGWFSHGQNLHFDFTTLTANQKPFWSLLHTLPRRWDLALARARIGSACRKWAA